ncbi:MAG: MogA/MoaB family molybdenum cofactor biosynthesis protein [Terracidiphilus sp.]|nr:MogA/MoaB family molybdenum cofactor biosynthesis protein [Terracidiphilus sp.]
MLVGVLTVSDRCSQGLMVDTSGPAIEALVRDAWPEATIAAAVVNDDEDRVVAWLHEWTTEGAALVLTVGGTGLGPRDRTPEATLRVLEREAPGLAEAMRARGAQKNEMAWLSRGVAGIKGRTLIVNLPGSLRGASESLEAILPLLDHALVTVSGGDGHGT